MRRTLVSTALVLGAVVAVSGCTGTTTAAPTPVQSSDLTSSDGGFDEHAVVGVVLLPAAATPGATSGGTALPDRFRSDLTTAGFRPDVRVASATDPAASQASDVRDLVGRGAKALVIEAADPSALTGAVQTAHDAGVVVIALGDALPSSGTGGDGIATDYRVQGTDSDAALVGKAVAMVVSLQRGTKPTGD